MKVFVSLFLALCLMLPCYSAYGAAKYQLNMAIYCPSAKQLYRDNLVWAVKGDAKWVTFTNSFANHIGAFKAAHWNGAAGVGSVICEYVGANKQTFPVFLQNSELFKQPTGGLWRKEMARGVINCFGRSATKPTDCPFYLYQTVDSPIDEASLRKLWKRHYKSVLSD